MTSAHVAEFIRRVAERTGVETAVVHNETWNGVSNIRTEKLSELLDHACFDHVVACNESSVFQNRISSNCNSVWLTIPKEASLFDFNCPSCQVDSILCSGRLEADRLQSKLRLPMSKFEVVGTVFEPVADPVRLMTEFVISVVCLSGKDRRILKHIDVVLPQFVATTGRTPQVRILGESMELSDLDGSFVVLVPGFDETVTYQWILDYCSSRGIPVSSGYASDLYLNHGDMTSVLGLEREIIRNCCLDDLSREQLSNMLWSSFGGGSFNTFMQALGRSKASTTRYIKFPQSVRSDVELDEIWLHCGTGLGDMLMAGSAIESIKSCRPQTRIGVTVKSNDEGGEKRGNKIFEQIFGNNPYIDRVEFFDMEKKGSGYAVTIEEIASRGIDPNLLFSVDLVPSHLMKHGTRTSTLKELWRSLNAAPNWHQQIFTDEKSAEFGRSNADRNTVVFCLEGSPVHKGRTTLDERQCTELVVALREHLPDRRFVGIGFGDPEREEWYAKLFDECFYNRTTVREDVDLVRNCGIMVAVDTGMAHVAMHLDVPLLGIYHAANIRYWVDEHYLRDPKNGFVVCPGDSVKLFKALYAVRALERIQKQIVEKERVVVVLPGGRGDNILAEPAVRKLAEECDVALSTQWPQLWNGHESVSLVHSMKEPDNPVLSEKIVGRRTILLSGVRGIIEKNPKMHVSDAYAEMCSVAPGDRRPRFYLESWESERAQRLADGFRKKIVAIAPEATHPNRMWFSTSPDDYWKRLIMLVRRMHFEVVAVGVSKPVDGACSNLLVSERGEREAVAFLTACDYFIGVDSFMAHAAAAVGLRGLVVWGPTSAENWGHDTAMNRIGTAPCAPCNRPRPYVPDDVEGPDGSVQSFVCPHRSCMRRCAPDDVFECFRFLVEGHRGDCNE